ncbi:hypothetical protein SHO565_77530 [Streptomyces sp. HO565]
MECFADIRDEVEARQPLDVHADCCFREDEKAQLGTAGDGEAQGCLGDCGRAVPDPAHWTWLPDERDA